MKIEDAKVLKECAIRCCVNEKCNVALMNQEVCYHVYCASNELCMPTLSPNPSTLNQVIMMLVRPVLPDESWEDIIRQESEFFLQTIIL